MNLLRIFLAALAAFVAYMAYGGLAFVLMPFLKVEFARYPAVYRDHDGQMRHFPIGMAGIFLSLLALATLYALTAPPDPGFLAGLRFGVIVAVFALGAFVLHNYANLNIGLALALEQSIMYFTQWIVVGIVIGLVYRPAIH